MLGEAARTSKDAQRYFLSYAAAIAAIARHARSDNPQANSGISVKLSALHPRYELVQRERVMTELVPRVIALAEHARAGNIGFNIDAEEADRLDLSLDVIEAVLSTRDLTGWDGFGVVVQAYSKMAPAVLDWLYALCEKLDRHISVRLVKGAYWDSEIKNAQLLGLAAYPVLTRKTSTDVSYLACARKLFAYNARIYPQFATHNAHTVCAVNTIAPAGARYEFQRLHGMGESLHEALRQEDGRQRRIYAPVGIHKDLLAYLVRRLLENGANSSFVHQILDRGIPIERIAADPVSATEQASPIAHPAIPLPPDLYGSARRNSTGWNLNNPDMAGELEQAMTEFRNNRWHAGPTIAAAGNGNAGEPVYSPIDPRDPVGVVVQATAEHADQALTAATEAFSGWQTIPVAERAAMLERAADLYEAHTAELFALATREAGKTRLDGIAEVREAVDFLRYYASEARRLLIDGTRTPLGPVVCISPWNFPLAIFTGQIAAALAAGNTVIAKPAEQTPLIAARAVGLLHQAGVPGDALILLPGDGAVVGAALTADARTRGVCFTGSTETARHIDRAMASDGDPRAALVAETGGLNAMIVDSTALPEQAVRDIVMSAFQSAGQRCSALRALFIQRDVAHNVLEMLEGAARELVIGDPWLPSTDVGPVIDQEAQQDIAAYCARLEASGKLLFRVPLPQACPPGTFIAPVAFRLEKLADLQREVFGPVLHVIVYDESELDSIVEQINAAGYGLTLGVHSRIDARVDSICARAHIGNIYINRNQIGAVVGVQPFGGEGLSGTGPKAGGPHYLTRFTRLRTASASPAPAASGTPAQIALSLPAPLNDAAKTALQHVTGLSFEPVALTGPTGERNTYSLHPRGTVLCLGPDARTLTAQAILALATGNRALLAETADPAAAKSISAAAVKAGLNSVTTVTGSAEQLARQAQFEVAMFDGGDEAARPLRIALAERSGPRIPLLDSAEEVVRLCAERVLSEDTTASGGNASLLALSH
jgi:RHH-type proline utilization regulon transcriptional repressor/proline dehydrogenase/delta 1-pyrroline-5-carboxylate dehydrogenase